MADSRILGNTGPLATGRLKAPPHFRVEIGLHPPIIAKFCAVDKQPIAEPSRNSLRMAHTEINLVVARALRYYMAKQGLSERELARKAQVAERTVGNFLHPERRLQGIRGKEPSGKLTELAHLAGALRIAVADLVTDATDEERESARRLRAASHILLTGEAPPIFGVDKPQKTKPS